MASLAPQILAALAAASNPSPDVRHQGEAQLQQLQANPSAYFASCAEILVSPEANLQGRQLVGFQLKNNLAQPACAQNPQLQSAICERAIVDPQKIIRNVASSIMSVAVREGLWPATPVVQRLGQILTQQAGELAAVHGAMRALSYIVDDAVSLLDAAELTGPVMQAVAPFLTSQTFGTTEKEAVEVRHKAIDIVCSIVELAGMDFECHTYHALRGKMGPVVQACFQNLQAPLSSPVATSCVRCLVLCLTFYEEISDAQFGSMLALMQQAMLGGQGAGGPPASSEEESLRIEATSFWRAVLHFPRFATAALPTIKESVVPLLIRAMVYSNMEIGMLEGSAEDWQVPDKEDSIRPRHYMARAAGESGNTNGGDDDEDEDDGDDDDEVEEWNLRRCSAITLDDISEYYGDAILLPVLQSIDAMMQPGRPWKELEAAVLALGAICEGCADALEPYLPDISTRLIQLLQTGDSHFLVVSITLWAGTRMAPFILRSPEKLKALMACIIGRMQSPSKMVQAGAVEALMAMLEQADEGQLEPFTATIVQTISQCLQAYQLKNRVLLFEALQTTCNVLGSSLRADDALVATLMGPLGTIWGSTRDDSPLLWGLFDCMSGVCSALGASIQPMAADVFNRSYALMHAHMQLRHSAARDATMELEDEEYLITSCNLLGGLFDAMGSGLEPLLAQHQPTFMQLVLAMLSDESSGIRQSGFCLASDISRTCCAYIEAVLAPFCDAAVKNISVQVVDEDNHGIISNVAWALCNLLEHQTGSGPSLQSTPAFVQLYGTLGRILGTTKMTADMRNTAENVALCLGVMLYTDGEVERKSGCAVGAYATAFCRAVRNIRESSSLLEAAMNGFLTAVGSAGPAGLQQVVAPNIVLFCDVACSTAGMSIEAQQMLKVLLSQVAQGAPQAWAHASQTCSAQKKQQMYEVYGLRL